MLPKKKWLPIAVSVLIVQIVLEAFAAYRLIWLNMLPDKYVTAAVAVLAAMVLLTCLLLFAGMGHGPHRARRVRRVIACVLAAVMAVGSLAASMVMYKVDETVQTVTTTKTTLQAMVGVYVLKDDKAQSIQDAKNYSFGIMADYDQDNTTQAVKSLESELGSTIVTVSRPSMTENAQALYDKSVNAMIMNEAYTSALTDTEQFADFSDKTRLLCEIPVEKTETIDPEDTGLSAASSGSDEKTELNKKAANSDITKTPFVVYISGSDTRSQMLDTSRSDVNILMAVNPETRQILLLNTPRDYYIPNPAGNGELDKLTHLGIYGINVSMQGLADLYQENVDYYGQINFTGFETLIDAIGGITVDCPQAFEAEGYSFSEGPNTMDGAQALVFARERHSFSSGDNERGRNQMRVITAVIQKITGDSANLLLHYSEVLDSLQGMFVTNLTSEDIASLVKMQIDDSRSWNVKSYAVTGTSGSEYTYSMPSMKAYVMYEDKDMVQKGADLIDKVMNGETLTDADVN
ncbi:MAG: LCP family protein [Bilifractor sp.]|jgi:LCP family protein required for cell wall assembly